MFDGIKYGDALDMLLLRSLLSKMTGVEGVSIDCQNYYLSNAFHMVSDTGWVVIRSRHKCSSTPLRW